MKKKSSIFILVLVMSQSSISQVNVTDDFDSSSLSKIWSTGRMEPHSIEIQSAVVRNGKSAAKITLRNGDIVEPGNDSSLASERDELEEAEYLYAAEGKTYEFKFSMFLPMDFPIVPTRLIIAQWKQKCRQEICSDGSPTLAIRYRYGKLMFTLNTDSGRNKLYEIKDEVRNRWLDFKFRIRFSQDSTGEIIGYLNDKKIFNYKGVTSFTPRTGYLSKNNLYYFKMGLYRDRMREPMVIYIDEYIKKEIEEK
jgi:hypothetical protein